MKQELQIDSRRAADFDFLHGRWNVRNERLQRRLAGSNDWETFDATQECRPLLAGLGNIDEFVTEWAQGFLGIALRLFNPRTRQWSIYWASNRTAVLEPPVIGSFEDGIGTFYGKDLHEGVPIDVRFIWSHITAVGARWQQAFSVDGGKTWETNWRMYMTRIEN